MLTLMEAVHQQCADLEPRLLETHFRRLPAAYFERYAAADIARHLHLLAHLTPACPVEVQIRPLTSHAFEVCVVGIDHAGVLACITAALAAFGFNLEDVQVSTYLEMDPVPSQDMEPIYFVILLRVSGSLRGRSAAELAGELRDRLRLAFAHLAEGNILEAQTAAADTRLSPDDVARRTPRPGPAPSAAGHEGLVLGGDFRLQQKLAVGGMSEVYLATQLSLNRTVAIKLIRHEAAPDDDLLKRFYQEGLVLGQFNCPSIVHVFAAGTIGGRAGGVLGWMAMEYMAGGDLARWQRQRGCPPLDLATRWFREALEALDYAHRHSVLHRDIKPHNLLLTEEGHLKVSDFGLLKQRRGALTGLTPHAAVVGTPHYMSPEQALGEAVDERSDIFSLGTTFFHLLSGRLPFNRDSMTAVLVQIAHEDAPPLTDFAPQTPRPLVVLVRRMMARHREERYQDVGVILEDLASYERRGLLKASDSGTTFVPVQKTETAATADETKGYPVQAREGEG